MKKLLFLASFVLAGYTLQAQTSPLYDVNSSAQPNKVYKLGTDPQFPFLRGLSTPEQVANAMHSPANRKKYPRQMKELDNIMKGLGFEHGAKDVKASDITAYTVDPGETGNMGNGKNKYSYSVMKTSKPQKAWKVTGNSDKAVALMNACGNAFYSSSYTGNRPCKNEEVAVTSDPKEITPVATREVKKKVYVYYKKGCPCRDCGPGWSRGGYEEGRLSRPLLVKTVKGTRPVTYKVTTNNTGNALICKGKTTEVTTDIVVEKENEYAGYRPVKKEYIEVSRHEYKRLMKNKDMTANVLDRPALEECTDCNKY